MKRIIVNILLLIFGFCVYTVRRVVLRRDRP